MKKLHKQYWQMASLLLWVAQSYVCWYFLKTFGEGKIAGALSVALGFTIFSVGAVVFALCEPAIVVWELCFGKVGWGLFKYRSKYSK